LEEIQLVGPVEEHRGLILWEFVLYMDVLYINA
jgi:hypothetical protein